MILYQKRTLAPPANVGNPAPLPQALVGLSDVSLADLPTALHPQAVAKLGLANTGYVPVVIVDVPQTVTRLQLTTAFRDAGVYNAVANAINALPNTDPVKVYFLNAATFGRQDQRMLDFATAMNQTAAQVDAFFIAAGAVPQ